MIHRRKCVQKKKKKKKNEDNFMFFITAGFVSFPNKITRPYYKKKKKETFPTYVMRAMYRHANMRCGSQAEPSASNNNHHASCSIKISTGRGVNFLAPFIQHHGARKERRRRRPGPERKMALEMSRCRNASSWKKLEGKKNKTKQNKMRRKWYDPHMQHISVDDRNTKK